MHKIKCKSDDNVKRYKARLVEKRFTQLYDVDFKETFALVVRQEIIRFVLSLATSKCWIVQHMDMKSAFLNGHIYEEVYVVQPQDIEVLGK